jgi:hypothetical protein
MPEFLHGGQDSEKRVYDGHDGQAQSNQNGGKFNDMNNILRFFAAVEQFLPIATQGRFQIRQRRQTWKIFPRFKALNVPRTCANFFGQFFLRQFSPASQRGDVFPEPCPMRTAFWFAHRHCQILSKRRLTKHEALHRALFFLIMNTQRVRILIFGGDLREQP